MAGGFSSRRPRLREGPTTGWIEIVRLRQHTGAETIKPLEESGGMDGGTGLALGNLEII